jgi:acetate---CoA ligase (ADP-forming)
MAVFPPSISPEETGRLRDGTRVRLRAALPTDRRRVLEFLRHVSRKSFELRFLTPQLPETAATEILSPHGLVERVSLLLELPEPGPVTVIAHGEYVRSTAEPTHAEIAFLVADDHQGQGAATLLLERLARRARASGIRQFDAVVLPENQAMIDVLVGAGFPCSSFVHDGLEHLSIDITHESDAGVRLLASTGNRPRLRA